jgi:hypothetical protein
MTDDRATRQSISAFLSEPGGGESVRRVSGDATAKRADDKPARTRNLRVTFRAVPGVSEPASAASADPGFPGTRAFAPHRPDRRETGAVVEAARAGTDPAPAPAPGANDPARRNPAVSPARPAAAANGPAVAAAARSGRGRLRGRPAGGKEKSVAAGPALPALPAAIKKLIPKDGSTSIPVTAARLLPTEAERSDARRLFREIGERFNENRKKSKTAAYAGYRHDLMANLDTLVMGGALDLKDATTIITNLEQYTRETEQESTETPATILGRWLRMEPGEVGELEPVVAEPIDANNQPVSEDEAEEEEESVESEPA